MVRFAKVKLERASDAVFTILRESILDQTFLPGQRLNVKQLAEKMEVSLTPVKDAVNRLVSEGLVEIRPRSGTYVSQLSPKDIAETLAVRRALEWLAAESVIRNMTGEDLDQFRSLVTALEQPVTNERERQAHERKNVEFHQLLVELSGNRKMIEIYRSLNAHIKVARVHYSSEGWERRLESEAVEHQRILKALESRNVRELQRALNDHIKRGADALVQDLNRKVQQQDEDNLD